MNRIALVLVLAACGPDLAPSEPAPYGGSEEELQFQGAKQTTVPKIAGRCVADETFSKPLVWACDTVKAMRVQSIEVTNADGTKPWTKGLPRVSAQVQNTSDQFINYPGLRFDAAGLASVTEQRYGIFGCDTTEMIGAFATAPASGTRVTFTAVPISLSSVCPAVTLSVSAIAP